MTATEVSELGLLLDIDGVLYVDKHPVDRASETLEQLREISPGVRLVTNTTSRSRREVFEQLRALDFELVLEEVLTPAALAVSHCEERGYESVALLVSEKLREDLSELDSRARGEGGAVDAVILGDMGDGFTPQVLNDAFRLMMDGAELVALQHNRYWRRSDGLVLDVGAYASALEYATGREAHVVGKPAREFFLAAMADLGVEHALMVGDDVEADVGGAMAAGLPGVLVRTGKFRHDALTARVTPTAIIDSIADLPELLSRLPL
jgi:phospholysine phosphohistidine inorganic pyrophosphate phosphatase